MRGPKVNFGGRCFRKIEKHRRNRVFPPYSIVRRPIAMMQKNNPPCCEVDACCKKATATLTAHESFLRVEKRELVGFSLFSCSLLLLLHRGTRKPMSHSNACRVEYATLITKPESLS